VEYRITKDEIEKLIFFYVLLNNSSGQHHEREGLSALRQQWTASRERGAICIKTAVDSITTERGCLH
jgi:hypothetical protein